MPERGCKIFAVASGGGHFVQLRRVAAAFGSNRVTYVTTMESYRKEVGPARMYVVSDGNLRNKLALVRMSLRLLYVIARERPDIVVSTGAAPGYIAIRIAKLLGARTIWIDSIANAETLSLSGQRVGRFADLWLTQWPHLASELGPHFKGAVL